jgi:hypothetical protein
MLAYLLDSGNFHAITFKAEDEAMKTGQLYSPLPSAISFQTMASKSRKLLQFIDVVCRFDDVYALNKFPGNFFAVGFFCFQMMGILFLEFPCSKSDFQNPFSSKFIFTLRVECMGLAMSCQDNILPKG